MNASLDQDVVRQAPAIIMFGGTFDPPHAGHAACIEALAKQFRGSRILVIPSADPPPTGNITKTPWLSFANRIELCLLMVKDLGLSDRIEVSGIEGTLPRPNYTVNTLKALKSQLPSSLDGRLALTMGGDQFASFHKWREADQIIAMADLIVAPRAEDPIHWPAGPVGLQARIWTLNVKTPAAASTDVRAAVHSNTPIPAGWLSPRVLSRLQELTGKAIETRS
jgi:nicotinate-nucleotide adenylyltransferase